MQGEAVPAALSQQQQQQAVSTGGTQRVTRQQPVIRVTSLR